MMKILSIICFAVAISWIGSTNAEWGGHINPQTAQNCANQLGLNVQDMMAISQEMPIPEINSNYNRLAECIDKSSGFLNADGTRNIQNTIAYINNIWKLSGKDTSMVRNCLRPQGASIGQSSVKSYNCIVKGIMNSLLDD